MSNKVFEPHSKAPAIWEFVEPIEFLKAQYHFRKEREPHFSFASWAEELGLKSRSFLRLVLIGKRSLTEDMSHLFIQNLKLNKSETTYFTHLVGLHRATQLQAKEFHSRELTKLRRKFQLKNHSVVEVRPADLFEFLSSYQIPRLQVLLTLSEVEKAPENLARLLKMKESEVSQHLATLQGLGLAEKNESGKWNATENKIGTPDALGNIALQSFHRKSLEESVQALTLPKESRRYQSLVMALTPGQFEELHHDLREVLNSYAQKFEMPVEGPKKVYQINLNIIPVSESIDRSNPSETVEDEPTLKEQES